MIKNAYFKQTFNYYKQSFINHSNFIPKLAFGASLFSGAALVGTWTWTHKKKPQDTNPDVNTSYPRLEQAEPEIKTPTPQQMKVSDSDISRIEQGKLEVNTRQLIQAMGVSMYSSSVAETGVKELLQNAFDAVKEAVHKKLIQEGDIQITLNQADRTITVQDNGIGMTPEIIRSAFFTLGGTHKDVPPELRSGGYGQAKIAFLFGVKQISLKTTREGITAEVNTSPQQLLNTTFDILTTKTPESKSGTTVKIWIPERAGDKEIYFSPDPESYRAIRAPLIGPTKLTVKSIPGSATDSFSTRLLNQIFSKTKVIDNGIQFKTPFHSNLEFTWGTVSVYSTFEEPTRTKFPSHYVLSSGIHQFSDPFHGDHGQIPCNLILDIKPKVFPNDPTYPFTNNREAFRGILQEDIEKLEESLVEIINEKKRQKTREALSRSFCLEEGDQWKPLLKDKETYEAEKAKMAEKTVSETFSKLFGNKVVKAEPSIFVKCDGPIYINYLKQDVFLTQTKKDTGELFAELGKTFLMMKNAMANHPNYRKIKNPDYFTGIGISEEFHGTHIFQSIQAILINPLSPNANSIDGICRGMINTMTHELAHTVIKGHGVEHNNEMNEVRNFLADRGVLTDAEKQIKETLTKHKDLYLELKSKFKLKVNNNCTE